MGNSTSATKMGRTELAKLIPSSKLSQKTSNIPPLLDNKSSNEIANGPTKCRFANKRPRNMMKWSPLDPRSSYDVRKCLVSGSNTKIPLAQDSRNNDLPQLRTMLGLKYTASTDDVLSILNSSSAFSAKAIVAAGFVSSDLKRGTTSGTKEILEVEEEPKTGSVRVKIGIPMQYEDELAGGKKRTKTTKEK